MLTTFAVPTTAAVRATGAPTTPTLVTLTQVRRYLEFARNLLRDDASLTEEAAELLDAVSATLVDFEPHLAEGFTEGSRLALMDALGDAGTAYRERVYSGFSGRRVVAPRARVQSMLELAQRYADASLRANARADLLYHSYNILDLAEDGARIRRLPVMLEGQVAVLGSGLLGAEESLSLLSALRHSPLYRADQHSYLLYPDKDLPGFLSRNQFSASRADDCPLVDALVEAGDGNVVVGDVKGDLHFAAGIRRASDVETALDRLASDSTVGSLVESGRAELLAIFEEVFNHAEFTGRSGSFFAYEGLGSIYWHMVSKRLLSVQETLERARAEGAPASVVRSLEEAYEDVRGGLGYAKPAEVYGAFPADPYSHTPGGHGARQPGMTGQVKEEVLTHLGELGLRVEDGAIVFRPSQLRDAEWTREAARFDFVDALGHATSLDLPQASVAFTFCQVPVVYRKGEELAVRVEMADGSVLEGPGGRIAPDVSDRIFRRSVEVRLIEAHVA